MPPSGTARRASPGRLRTPGQHEGQLTTGRIESSAPGSRQKLAAFPDGEGGERRSAAMMASKVARRGRHCRRRFGMSAVSGRRPVTSLPSTRMVRAAATPRGPRGLPSRRSRSTRRARQRRRTHGEAARAQRDVRAVGKVEQPTVAIGTSLNIERVEQRHSAVGPHQCTRQRGSRGPRMRAKLGACDRHRSAWRPRDRGRRRRSCRPRRAG